MAYNTGRNHSPIPGAPEGSCSALATRDEAKSGAEPEGVQAEDRGRLKKTVDALRKNGFRVHFCRDKEEARRLFLTDILERLAPRSVSWGDSLTLHALNLLPELRSKAELDFIRTFGDDLSSTERFENRRRALSCDLFLTGTNAITSKGQLVNLDMVGNRVAGIVFGPRKVVLFVGTNKIVEGLEEAMERIRTIAAPLNAKRHEGFNTPCVVLGKCVDCSSPDRICNTWVITEKSYPKERIEIVLIDEPLGL